VSCLRLGLFAVVVAAIVFEATQTTLVSTSDCLPFHHSSCIAFDGFIAVIADVDVVEIELFSHRTNQKM